jgi:hypothetical protein
LIDLSLFDAQRIYDGRDGLTDRGEAGLNPMEGVAPRTGRIGDGDF